MSDEEDETYDFDPKNIVNEVYTGEDDEKKKEKEKKFLSKKRNLNDINENNNETKENLLDDILN